MFDIPGYPIDWPATGDPAVIWPASAVWPAPVVWPASVAWPAPVGWPASVVWPAPVGWPASVGWPATIVWLAPTLVPFWWISLKKENIPRRCELRMYPL